jgi:hypothetical protein
MTALLSTSKSVSIGPDWAYLTELYQEGASDVEIALELKIPLREFYKMEKELPTFARFVELGRTMSQAWWYSRGRKNLGNKEFNTSLYNFTMKNRFGWADKVETTEKAGDETLNSDQLRSEINRIAKKLARTSPELLRDLNE